MKQSTRTVLRAVTVLGILIGATVMVLAIGGGVAVHEMTQAGTCLLEIPLLGRAPLDRIDPDLVLRACNSLATVGLPAAILLAVCGAGLATGSAVVTRGIARQA